MSSRFGGWRDSGRFTIGLQAMSIAGSLMFSPASFAADEHSQHGASAKPSASNVVYQAAGPEMHDRMMKEVARQQEFVNTKGGYASGADSHMMQQGVLLVADDPTKVAVTPGGRCPANAPVK